MVIEGEGESHDAWFATTPDHRVLAYDNGPQRITITGDADFERPDAPSGIPVKCAAEE
jgi:hypothetical protein